MNLFIFSDIQFHLNKNKSIMLEDRRSSWFKLQLDITRGILEEAVKAKVDYVLHNGDLFEDKDKIDVVVYNEVFSLFSEFKEKGLKFIFNVGNHDKLSVLLSSLKPFSVLGEVCSHTRDFEFESERLRVIPYGQVIGNLSIPDTSKKNILATHEDISELTLGPLDFKSKSRLKKQIFTNWDIVFNGHIHKPQTLDNIVNIGSPLIQDWGEKGENKRYIIYNSDSGIKSVPIKGPKFITLETLTEEDIARIKADDFNFYKIKIDSSLVDKTLLDKHNIFPIIQKKEERERRMDEALSIEDSIKWYVGDSDTELDKAELQSLGLRYLERVKGGE